MMLLLLCLVWMVVRATFNTFSIFDGSFLCVKKKNEMKKIMNLLTIKSEENIKLNCIKIVVKSFELFFQIIFIGGNERKNK